MVGGAGRSGGHSGGSGLQSKKGGHSTLNENSTSASCGSKPVSTSVTVNGSSAACVAELTSRSVYGEKSPAALVPTRSTSAALGSDVKKVFCAAVMVAGGVVAVATKTALMSVMLSPPAMRM